MKIYIPNCLVFCFVNYPMAMVYGCVYEQIYMLRLSSVQWIFSTFAFHFPGKLKIETKLANANRNNRKKEHTIQVN
jgi:hypothetical protein